MLVIVYGTTGELIKLLPLLKSLDRSQYLTICTYQQPQQLKQLFEIAQLPPPDIKIGQPETADDLEKLTKVPLWIVRTLLGYFANYRKIKKLTRSHAPNAVIVHGDTMTTVLGSIMGILLRYKVVHIEAGLRSYNWRHPFPEEIDRMITSKLARIHFAPGDIPMSNLAKARARGIKINTKFNTVLDSLRLAQASKLETKANLPSKFGVVSIHRNELLAQPIELRKLLESLKTFSEKVPLVYLDHPVTKERVRSLKMDHLLQSENIIRLPKMSYFPFIQLVSKAELVVTDSGGLQEETAYLGIPCLIHRKATERQEGLDSNVVLSYYDQTKVNEFLDNYQSHRTDGVPGGIKPTNTIMNKLKELGYLK